MAKRQKGQAKVEKKANALQTLTVEYVAVDTIGPNDYNPNRQSDHDFQLLLKSMSEDGFTQPIVVQESTMQIVDGEHRWRAALELGLAQVPIVKVNMSVEQMRIATLRHNRARGSEDIELSAQVLRDLQELGAIDWAMDSLQMSDEEMNRLIEDVPAPEALMDPEFSEAWTPTREIERGDGQNDLGEGQGVAHSAAAADALRAAEVRVAAAKTDEERTTARAEAGVYRLVAVFAAEEKGLVMGVLGDNPSEKILELCRGVAGVTIDANGG
jgi:ParB/RepB/Spo0J family partition protein